VAPLIAAFSAAYPEITIDLTVTDRMVDMIEDGIDLAIRFNQPPDSSLIVRRLGQFRVILCAAPDYLAKHGAPKKPSDLSRHNCLAYAYRGFDRLAREWPLSGPDGEVTVPVTGNLQTNNLEVMLGAAFEGRGIAMVTSCSAADAIGSGRLVQVLPDWHSGEFPIIALYPHRQYVPAKVRSFLDFAGKYFAANPTCPDITTHVEDIMQRERVVAQNSVAPAFMKPRRMAI
jgi:DNA-binding transcriptional LysR family regulator